MRFTLLDQGKVATYGYQSWVGMMGNRLLGETSLNDPGK